MGKILFSFLPRRISWGEGGGGGGQLSRVSYSGRNCSGKNVQGQKSRMEIALEGVSWGSIVQRVIVQEGNYSGVIIQRAKVRRVIFLEGIF